jgi:L-iditol 2-dehydrogenase
MMALCATISATPPISVTSKCLAKGSFIEYVLIFHCRLPDHVSLEEGALIEPLSVGIHAARRSNIRSGDRVFIFGAGPVGLLTAAAAKAAGAAHITIAGKKSRKNGGIVLTSHTLE